MRITTDIKKGKSLWGRMPLPAFGTIIGTVMDRGVEQALIWMPTGYWSGGGGALSRLDPHAAQRGWLRAIRDNHGWDLLDVLGVSQRTWEGWEQGRRNPSPETMLAIYEAITQSP